MTARSSASTVTLTVSALAATTLPTVATSTSTTSFLAALPMAVTNAANPAVVTTWRKKEDDKKSKVK